MLLSTLSVSAGLFPRSDLTVGTIVSCSIALVLFGVLCAASGIGGGGIIVSVLMEFGNLRPADAVPLSKAIVFQGAVCTLVLNLRKQAFANGTPLINWHMVKLMVPMSLIGTFLGVILNSIVPEWMIVFVLSLILVCMTAMSMSKTWKYHQQEQLERILAAQGGTGTFSAQDVPLGEHSTSSPDNSAAGRKSKLATYRAVTKLDSADGLLLPGMFCIIIVGSVLFNRAEACAHDVAGSASGVVVGGACKDVLLTSVIGGDVGELMSSSHSAWQVLGSISLVAITPCLSTVVVYAHNVIVHHNWTVSSVLLTQMVGFFTGILAALVGIGGGLVFSPFFLIYGLDPAVSIATASTCMLFTSSSTSFQYFLAGRINPYLAVVFGAANTASSYLGTSIVHHVQDHYTGRKSYVSVIIVLAVGASALMSVMKLTSLLEESYGGQLAVSSK